MANELQTGNQFGETVPTVQGNVKVGVGETNYQPDPIPQDGVISIAQSTVFRPMRSSPEVEAILGEAKYTEKVEAHTAPQMQERIGELENKLGILLNFIQAQGMVAKVPSASVIASFQPGATIPVPKPIKDEMDALNYQQVCKRARDVGITVPRGAKKNDVIELIISKV